MTAQFYDAWRVRSLSILTREDFSLEREFALMLDWLGVKPGQHYLDVGTSTGNYARAVAERGASVMAIDISKPMLEKTRERLAGLNLPITLELANVEALPYADSSFDGVTIGASLNEFASTRSALLECARVLKPGGKLFMMYLRRSDTLFGRALQAGFALSGVRFPDRDAVRQVLSQAGLERQRAEVRRAVTFELFVKTGRVSEPPASSVALPRMPGKPQREPLS
jgi:SAM-dependent methyltransferase